MFQRDKWYESSNDRKADEALCCDDFVFYGKTNKTEFDIEDLYAEYEMNESIHSEIVLEEEGEEDFEEET